MVTPAGLGTGTLTAHALLEGLSATITPAIAAAIVIYQTLIGTGLTVSTAFFSSIFIKEQSIEEEEKSEKIPSLRSPFKRAGEEDCPKTISGQQREIENRTCSS